MVDMEKLVQFANFKSLNKFKANARCEFLDGTLMSNWFHKYKQEILISDNKYAIMVRNDYKKYESDIRVAKIKDSNGFYYLMSKNIFYAKEFMECNDTSKFDFGSDIKFSSGESMNQWFIENKRYIFSSKSDECKKIVIQYNEKLKKDECKKKLLETKYRFFFYKEHNIMKFDEYSNIKFFDGKNMYQWFKENEENIFLAKDGIFFEIQMQYDMYKSLIDLKKEFFNQNNMDKFNEEGWVKFSTGAIMYFWWECYMDKILNSSNPLDIKIRLQYEKYCDSNIYNEQELDANSKQIKFNN